MGETYDEFSELLVENDAAAVLLPPSASLTIAAAMEAVTGGDDDENLDDQRSVSSEEDDADEHTQYVGTVADEESATHDGATRSDHSNDENAEEQDEAGENVDEQDGRAEDEEEGTTLTGDGDRAEGDDSVERGVREGLAESELVDPVPPFRDITPHGTGNAAPHFAVSRIKALFKFGHEATLGETNAQTQCVLSTDAAVTLSEAIELMLTDFVTASVAETQRKDKKTLSYDDVSFVVSHLDRFAFLSDTLPLLPAVAQPKLHPTSVAKSKTAVEQTTRVGVPRGRRANQPPPAGGATTNSGAPQRQLKLHFAPNAAAGTQHQPVELS